MLGSAAGAEAACTLSASAVSFGTYDVFQAGPTDSTGTITFRCAADDKDIRIAISSGTSSTFSPRTLVSGARKSDLQCVLRPELHAGLGRRHGRHDDVLQPNPPNNRDIVLTMYARIPAGQDIPIGSYADTLVVTLEYSISSATRKPDPRGRLHAPVQVVRVRADEVNPAVRLDQCRPELRQLAGPVARALARRRPGVGRPDVYLCLLDVLGLAG